MDLFDELRRNSSGPPQLLLGKCFPTKWLSEFRLLCVHFVCVRKSERTFRYLQNLFAMTERTGERPSWADEGEDRIEGKVVPLVLSKPYYRLLGDIPKSCFCFFSFSPRSLSDPPLVSCSLETTPCRWFVERTRMTKEYFLVRFPREMSSARGKQFILIGQTKRQADLDEAVFQQSVCKRY